MFKIIIEKKSINTIDFSSKLFLKDKNKLDRKDKNKKIINNLVFIKTVFDK
jgi:hypothetical protein